MAVSAPFDILELRDQGQLVTRVTAFEEGPMTITPRDGRGPKVVQGVRLHVPPEDKGTAPDYWDFTAQTPKPSLLRILPVAVSAKRWIRLTKYGSGADARFSVELLPNAFSGPPKADTANQAGP